MLGKKDVGGKMERKFDEAWEGSVPIGDIPDGDIPVCLVKGDNLPDTWERSLLTVWERGIDIKTQYDKAGDPSSKDCTMIMVINEPLSEPRIHRCFPGGLEDLEMYRQEVLYGIHDSWVDTNDPTKWDYTYHERLMAFKAYWADRAILLDAVINQVNDYLIPELAKTPYSRRVQAITWQPWLDTKVADPPCLQRIWVRMPQNKQGQYVLNMHTYWRSRDAFKASFMNLFAMSCLQEYIADEIAKKIGQPVLVGRMVDTSDSYHIYGSYFKEAQDANSFQGFLETIKTRTFEQRTWTMEFAEPFFQEAREKLARDSPPAGSE